MSLSRVIVLLGVLLFLNGAGALAQGWMGYDPATEETVCGIVEEVWGRELEPGWTGIHLRVRSDREAVEVRVGPVTFVASKGIWLEPGDRVEITGSRIVVSGKPVVIARRIETGGEELVLRTWGGTPLWGGGYRGGRGLLAVTAFDIVIPEGDPVAGRHAFTALRCNSCHVVDTDASIDGPVAEVRAPVLGPAAGSAENVAAAILTPSHYVHPRYEAAEGGLSPMGDFSEAMTLRQWVDIVSYIRAPARLEDRTARLAD